MKKIAFFLYSWSTTIFFVALLFWLATLPNFGDQFSGNSEEVIKTIYRLLLYSILFLLIYRSLITTFRYTVDRLAAWRTDEEKEEDSEFVLIVETLITVIAILSSVIIAVIEEIIQGPYGLNIEGRSFEVKDILVSTLSALLAGIVVYTIPVIGELEVSLKNKFSVFIKNIKKKSSK